MKIHHACGLLLASVLLPMLALAHEGHGPADPHWHATDAWGFIVVGALLAAAFWLGRRK
jgi:hypothetical protein